MVQPISSLRGVETDGDDAGDELRKANERIQEDDDHLATSGVEIHCESELLKRLLSARQQGK